MTPAKFVVLEGLDGSGTTTQQHLAAEWAHSADVPLLITAEPSDSSLGKVLRHTLEGSRRFDKRTLALLFAADRNEHLRSSGGMLEQLDAGTNVLCDRYMLSALAYQADEELSIDYLLEINSFARAPDVTIFISTPPDVCAARLGRRGGRDIFDDAQTQQRVYSNYLKLLDRTDIAGQLFVIDGARDVGEVAADVQSALKETLQTPTVATASVSPQESRASG